jgi:hypothetical protein
MAFTNQGIIELTDIESTYVPIWASQWLIDQRSVRKSAVRPAPVGQPQRVRCRLAIQERLQIAPEHTLGRSGADHVNSGSNQSPAAH